MRDCAAFGFEAALLQQRGDPALQRFEFALQQARLHIGQHLPRGQQGLQFARADPDTGQFERLVVAAVVVEAPGVRILLDRRAEEIAQFVHQPVQSRLRAFQAFHQVLPRDRRAPLVEDVVQVIEAFDF